MLEYDFEQSVGYWLTITTQAYHRALQDELAPHGITYRQSQVLGWLALEGRMSQTELATKMLIEPPSLVGVLDRMERAGWITRRSCSSDRRRKFVCVMPDAAPAWETIVQCARRVRAQAISGLSPRQLATLNKLLTRMSHNLGTRTPRTVTSESN